MESHEIILVLLGVVTVIFVFVRNRKNENIKENSHKKSVEYRIKDFLNKMKKEYSMSDNVAEFSKEIEKIEKKFIDYVDNKVFFEKKMSLLKETCFLLDDKIRKNEIVLEYADILGEEEKKKNENDLNLKPLKEEFLFRETLYGAKNMLFDKQKDSKGEKKKEYIKKLSLASNKIIKN